MDDLSEDELVAVLGSLFQAAGYLASHGQAGIERASTIASSVFLHGTARCQDGAVSTPER